MVMVNRKQIIFREKPNISREAFDAVLKKAKKLKWSERAFIKKIHSYSKAISKDQQHWGVKSKKVDWSKEGVILPKVDEAYKGIVVGKQPYGLFIKTKYFTGLLHKKNSLASLKPVKVGTEVTVEVHSFSKDYSRISFKL